MFHLRRYFIFLTLTLSVVLFFASQASALWVVCDSWICATEFDHDNFGVMCYSSNKAEDCPSGGACTGSTNMDCYGQWSCPDATITCNSGYGGCTDSNAYNYDPGASWNDGSCQYSVYGCTDPNAANFAGYPPAVIDDGSCQYFVNLNFWVHDQLGRPVSNAQVYIDTDYGNGQFRNTDGGGFANFGVYMNNLIFYTISVDRCSGGDGAVFTGAWSNDVNFTTSCPYVFGCTDPNATNYNPSADVDDGTCSYCVANEGSVCYSSPNICGQTGSGTIQCNGSCSATTPPNSSCPAPNAPANVTITEPNYCVSGPATTISWTYSDPSGSPQSAYQVQIDNQGGFGSPEVDSGKVLSGSNAWFSGQGVLAFNTVYHVRAKTWNGFDIVSPWGNASVCSGPGCTGGGADSWKTPQYAYPQVDFSWTANGILNNPSPPLNKPVTFTDATVFNGNPNGRQWSWTFGDGGSSAVQNPSHTYAAEGSYYVTLTATDNANQTCARTKGPLMIQKPIPRWREIAPR